MLGPGVVRPSVPRSLPPFRTHYPQVAEGGPAREPLQLLEVSPRKRLPAGPEQDPCGSRPAPEGAGAGAEQGHSAGGGGWCRHCHTKLAELKRQAWKLVSGPGTRLRVSGPSLGRPLRAGPVLELGRLWVAEGVFLASPYSSPGLRSSVCKCVWVGAVRPTGSCCGTGGGWAGVSPGAADAAQLEPRPGLGRGRGRGRRELDGRDSTQGGTAGAPPAARGYLVRSCPWGTWALSQASGNCTSGAGGLGPPEGGPAAVGGCSLSPPSITTRKSRVGDAAWGSVTLGSGHSSRSPRLHPQPPRCFCQGRGLRGVLRPMGWPWSWKELGPLFKEQ